MFNLFNKNLPSHILAKVNFPIYVIKVLTDRHVLVAGGGGETNSGIKNSIEIYELFKCPKNDIYGSKMITHFDTGSIAIMNATVLQKDDHFILATGGRFGSCFLYKIEFKIEKNNDKQIKSDNNQTIKKFSSSDLIKEKLFKFIKNKQNLSLKNNEIIKSTFTISLETEFQADFNTVNEPYLKVVRYSSNINCLITGGSDGYIRLFDYSNFKLIKSLKAHNDEIINLIIDQTGSKLISISRDRHAYVWSLLEPLTKLTKLRELIINNYELNRKYDFRDCIFDKFESKKEKIIKTELKTTSIGEIELNQKEFNINDDNKIKLKNKSNEIELVQSLYTLHNSFARNKPPIKSLICKWNTVTYEIEKFVYTSQESFSKITINDDNQYLGIGLLSGTVEIYDTINLHKLYSIKNSHNLFVTDLEFLKSFNNSNNLIDNQKASLLSTSVDQIIIAHYLSKNDEFGYLNSTILFISFLFFIYILFMYLGL